MPNPPILVLALGNDLLGDDGVGPAAARVLQEEFSDESVCVIESGEAGLALMEIMTGFRYALLLDCIQTKQCPVGTVLDLGPEDFRKVIAPSPHYAGLPEILQLAERLKIDFPEEIRVIALEVENPFDFQENFTPAVEQALPNFIEKARSVLRDWDRSAL